MTKPNWVNTSPNSGNGNGSIQVTAQANEGDARQGSVVVAGGGLSKTIAVNQDTELRVIGDFGRNSSNYGLWTTVQLTAIGIKGIAYCTMADSSVIEKKINYKVNVDESEHCMFVSLNGRRVDNVTEVVTFNMQTTLDFIGHADTLCEFFTDITFNSTEKNTQLDVTPFYESLVYEVNDCLMTMYPDNHIFMRLRIVDFDDATKDHLRSIATCENFVIVF